METESRDSVSLTPAELDEFGQLLASVGLPLGDPHLDLHIEKFPLVVLATDDELHGFLFGSLERIGGTPCILWGLGGVRRSKQASAVLKSMVGELYRRAAISFPDEDVLVGGRLAHPSAYAMMSQLVDVVPRPKYQPTGEERAWGRRLAKRFACDSAYDDRAFRTTATKQPAAIIHTGAVKMGGKAAQDLVGDVDPVVGEAVIVFGWAMAENLQNGLGHTGS
jgi:hypothetical protein